MSFNKEPSAERVHIGFFGLRNAGKSSLVNKITGQKLSVVSEFAGTTTDPVRKSMELLPIGPVVVVDTPGVDDEGALGEERVKRTFSELKKIDAAVLVVDCTKGLSSADEQLVSSFKERKIPYVIAFNKSDLCGCAKKPSENEIYVSAENGDNIKELKEKLSEIIPKGEERTVCRDLFSPGDVVVLVTPIDSAAPKGRLILPQQQTLRDILDGGGIAVVTKETELEKTLSSLVQPPRLVITDSQAFGIVNKIVPHDVPLTSFSILFARYKGELCFALKGAAALDSLKEGDTVLISEGCTHHRQCGDIGTVKLPKWIEKHSGKKLNFKFTSGGDFEEELSGADLVVHCGGCMLTVSEMKSRISMCKDRNIPITNYGMAIAKMHGILDRSMEILKDYVSDFE